MVGIIQNWSDRRANIRLGVGTYIQSYFCSISNTVWQPGFWETTGFSNLKLLIGAQVYISASIHSAQPFAEKLK